VLAYAIPHVFGAFIVNQYLYGRVRWPFFSELYETVQSIFLTPAVISTLSKPRDPTFKVTPKGKNLGSDFLSPLAAPFYLMFLIILITFPAAAIKWYLYPIYRQVIVIVGFWSLFNAFIAFACLGAVWERHQVRRHHRAWATGTAQIFFPRLNISVTAKIKDISLSGIGLEYVHPGLSIQQKEEVQIEMHDSYGEKYSLRASFMRVVARGEKVYCGGEFLIPDRETFSKVVKFVYGDSQRWVDFWETKSRVISPWKAVAYVVYKGFYGFHKSIRDVLQISVMALREYLSVFLRAPKALRQVWEIQRGKP
jgi:cellulose synthase (UDP-forming)